MLYVLLLLMASVASEVAVKDFEAQLDFLKRTRVQDVGRDALVVSYEKLIADNAKHPKVAQAMLDLVVADDGVFQFLHDGSMLLIVVVDSNITL